MPGGTIKGDRDQSPGPRDPDAGPSRYLFARPKSVHLGNFRHFPAPKKSRPFATTRGKLGPTLTFLAGNNNSLFSMDLAHKFTFSLSRSLLLVPISLTLVPTPQDGGWKKRNTCEKRERWRRKDRGGPTVSLFASFASTSAGSGENLEGAERNTPRQRAERTPEDAERETGNGTA